MTGNLGATSLKKRHRTADTMAMYDALPQPLRNWLTATALPWSPKSCKRIWDKSRKDGLDTKQTLTRLMRAEQKALTRDKIKTINFKQ